MRIDLAYSELQNRLIPFWLKQMDTENGGFCNWVNYDLESDPHHFKSAIMNCRLLWFFSECFLRFDDAKCLDAAEHAYQSLLRDFIDPEYGGIYWSVTYDGKPFDPTKYTYAQAFGIFALTKYYEATRDGGALDRGMDFFYMIETKMRDKLGYIDAFDRKFDPVDNTLFSEHGLLAHRTMNTQLHILEAYTSLYTVTEDEEVKEKLSEVLQSYIQRIWNPVKRRQELYFNADFISIDDVFSYGHDMEASWVLPEAAYALDDQALIDETEQIGDLICEHLLEEAFDGHSMPQDNDKGTINENRVWWIQAETVNGFLAAAKRNMCGKRYYEAAMNQLEFINQYLIDPREGSEWFETLYKDGTPMTFTQIVEPMKSPYHNGRMYFRMIDLFEENT